MFSILLFCVVSEKQASLRKKNSSLINVCITTRALSKRIECVFCSSLYPTENTKLFCKEQMVNWQLNLIIALQFLCKSLMFNKINDFETSGLLAFF